MIETERLPIEQIRTLFLFEALDDEQLAWLADNGGVEHRTAGELVYTEGQPATCFFVLLSGMIVLRRRVGGSDVEITRTEQRGVYAGATQAYVSAAAEPPAYPGSMQAITDSTFFVLDAVDFAEATRRWFPMAMHLLEGLFLGLRASNEIVAQRERLLSLGRLSAGLTHELNNPAAAAVRATSALRERVSAMRRKLGHLASGKLNADELCALTALQEEAVERLPKAPKLSPMQVNDAEDALSDWMDAHGIDGGWELSPTLVASGVDSAWLESRLVPAATATNLEGGLRWLTYSLETELLMNEIEDATTRISTLVGAAKQYTQMDRAPHQDIDVHDGIDSTLIMLGSKLKHYDIKIVKDYDRSLPIIPAYAGELNQVWTNLIDNAMQAMAGPGTLTIRTAAAGERVLVEIGDTGPGIAPEIIGKIFDPFFSTKPVGQGTGLGLDISYRIVVQRHGGDLKVTSEPGDTRFLVFLPFTEPGSGASAL